MSASPPPIDGHLLHRLRAAGAAIQWRGAAPSTRGGSARIAHLHDEEARVEERPDPHGLTFITDAGPVGALVLLLDIDRRAELPHLSALATGSDPAFAQGGITARWPRGSHEASPSTELPFADLVALARYALG